MIEPRTLRIWRLGAIGAGGGLALIVGSTFLPGLVDPNGSPSAFGILSKTGATVLGLGWTTVFALQAFRRSDEFRRTGAMFAWHWGALLGLLISVPVAVFVGLGGLHWIDPANGIDHRLGRIFSFGYALALASQVLGYFVMLAWWKGTNR